MRVLVFVVDDRTYALPLPGVRRIVRAVEITALPDAPDAVLGVVNVQGQVVPVFDLRGRFRLPQREIAVTDHIVIAETALRSVAILADSVSGVFEFSRGAVVTGEDLPLDSQYVQGVVKLENGMILIHDLNTFLSPGEAASLEPILPREAQSA